MAGPSHPLYLTDSIVGGGSYSDFQGETVFAGGVDAHGAPGLAGPRAPAGASRWCAPDSLRLSSPRLFRLPRLLPHPPPGPTAGTADAPFLLQWTPGPDTPALLYYQCTTHMKLGWEVRVVDAATA